MSTRLIYAEPQYPVDVSYLVSDFKYSQEHGLKICEVQHGALSTVQGDIYIAGEDGSISPRIAEFFALLPMRKWTAGWVYAPLKRSLAAKEWDIQQSMTALSKDPTFLTSAAISPRDPFSITAYAGIVYATLPPKSHRELRPRQQLLFPY